MSIQTLGGGGVGRYLSRFGRPIGKARGRKYARDRRKACYLGLYPNVKAGEVYSGHAVQRNTAKMVDLHQLLL